MSFRRFLLIGLLLLAFVLRVVALDQIPPGLSHDEAYNGVTAMQVLRDGQRPIFFEINKGIEPLIIYLEALAFSAFGIGPVPMRLVNVICGMLTVALAYPLAKRLFNRRVALLAMAGLTVSFWAIFTSRLALRAVTLPPLLLLTLYLLWLGLTANPKSTPVRQAVQNLKWFALTGLAMGATMYTYLSGRFVPLLVLAVFGHQLLRRQITRRHWLGLAITFLIWAILFAPLANYFWQHQDSFTERSSQVSTIPYALNGDFGPLLRHTLRTLAMFTFHGDETDRYNLSGRPIFDWLNGLFLYLGLGLSLVRLRRRVSLAGPAALLWLWFFFMLLPGFITDDSPHFLRTIGAIPVAYILWALGVETALQQISTWKSHYVLRFTFHASRIIFHPFSLIFLLLLVATFYTAYDYFGRWTNAPEARYIYGADIAEVAGYVNTTRDEGLVAISAEYYRDLDPFRFTLHSHGQPPFVIWFDGQQSLAFPPPESGLSPRYLFPLSAPPSEFWQPFLQLVPAESGREYTLYRLPEAATLRQAEATTFSAQPSLEVKVNNDLILAAYQVVGEVVAGGKVRVLLGWQALRALPPETDYTFLVQLQDKQGHTWATVDGNGYPPGQWQPGVQGLQLLQLRLSGDLPVRTYHLTAQVVDRRTGQPLPTSTGEPVIPLTTLAGQLAKTPRMIDPASLPNPISALPTAGPGQEIALRGYEVKNSTVHRGDSLALILYWQVLQPPPQNYRLGLFLVNDQAQTIYRWPAVEPINGEWPTRQWPADYWVQDRLSLLLGADIPPGQFALHVAWVAESTGPLQPLPGDSGSSFELGQVTIAE